jgi:hypothetical protein
VIHVADLGVLDPLGRLELADTNGDGIPDALGARVIASAGGNVITTSARSGTQRADHVDVGATMSPRAP